MKLFYLSVIFLLLIINIGCNDLSESKVGISSQNSGDIDVVHGLSEDSELLYASAISENGNSSEPVKTPVKLIKRAELVFETDSLKRTAEELISAVQKLGGYVSSENEDRSSYRITHKLTLRIPQSGFDEFISLCDGHGTKGFDKRVISASDVTEEFVDVQARVKTKKELESRYHDLLKKAKNVEEVIKVEREIGKLRSEIESAEGRLKYLMDRVSLSTVNVQFYRVIKKKQKESPNRLVSAFTSGWNGLNSFLLGLVSIWPLLVFITLGSLFIIRFGKRMRSVNKKDK